MTPTSQLLRPKPPVLTGSSFALSQTLASSHQYTACLNPGLSPLVQTSALLPSGSCFCLPSDSLQHSSGTTFSKGQSSSSSKDLVTLLCPLKQMWATRYSRKSPPGRHSLLNPSHHVLQEGLSTGTSSQISTCLSPQPRLPHHLLSDPGSHPTEPHQHPLLSPFLFTAQRCPPNLPCILAPVTLEGSPTGAGALMALLRA